METIICQDTNFGYVKVVLPETGLKRIIYTGIASLLPLWKRAVGVLFDRVPKGSVERGKNVYSFNALLAKYPPRPERPPITPREHLAYICVPAGPQVSQRGCPGPTPS